MCEQCAITSHGHGEVFYGAGGNQRRRGIDKFLGRFELSVCQHLELPDTGLGEIYASCRYRRLKRSP